MRRTNAHLEEVGLAGPGGGWVGPRVGRAKRDGRAGHGLGMGWAWAGRRPAAGLKMGNRKVPPSAPRFHRLPHAVHVKCVAASCSSSRCLRCSRGLTHQRQHQHLDTSWLDAAVSLRLCDKETCVCVRCWRRGAQLTTAVTSWPVRSGPSRTKRPQRTGATRHRCASHAGVEGLELGLGRAACRRESHALTRLGSTPPTSICSGCQRLWRVSL